jgi:hypothetical protein
MTTATDVRIVDAGPQHAGFVAWVTLAAFRSHLPKGMWDHMFGGTDEALVDYLTVLTTTDQPHWVHYLCFLLRRWRGRRQRG